MDVLADTDFPDIRMKSAIHSANEGNILIIPREGGYMVRLYIELDELAEDERIASRNITSDHLIAAARRILHPYSLEVREVAWWSVYEIGQRICDKFDDLPEDSELLPCVFIAGDACHTHSPKAGQGMNVSIADGFNLGWKLASVLRGQARPDLLHSYSQERRAIAQELIDFDREFAKMFSAPPREASDPSSTGVDPAEFQKVKDDLSLIPSLVDEAIRWVTPVKHFMRSATVDTQVRGQPIAAGDWLMLCYLSGNRDEEVFKDPFAFHVDRQPNRHLAFGYGPHVCLGQHLAKLEIRIFFEELLPRLQAISLDGEPTRSLATFVNGPKRLPVRYTMS